MPKKDYDKIHRTNMDVYARKIQAIYDSAVKEAAAIGSTVPNFDPSKPFSFSDYPITHNRVKKLSNELQSNLEAVVLNGIEHEWALSNNKNNELCNRVFGDNVGKLTKEQYRRYYSNNGNAADAFKARKTAGLNLSDRVWKYSDQFKTEIEFGIDLDLRDGTSATDMARNLKQYLQNPDKLFRRVRDEHGQLHLSKAAKAFKPGQGVYRSSVKNAQRLARTETNMAYHTADHERWQQFDFVVGVEVRRSNNLSCHCPLCDSLAEKYPKDFKFVGWHPQCRCHAVPVLKTIEELKGDTERIINGEPTNTESVNTVNQMPDSFTNWIEDNKERFGANNTPYFIRDNFKDGKISEGLIFGDRLVSATAETIKHINNTKLNTPYTLTEECAQKLKNDGWEFDKEIKDLVETFNNSPMSGFNIDEFAAEFANTFKNVGISVSTKRLQVSKNRVKLYMGDGDEVVFARTFTITDGRKNVTHDLFVLPDAMQGKGISKEVFQSMYKQYQKSGVKTIDVYANIDVGGYTWGRYGFSATREEASYILKARMRKNAISEPEFNKAVAIMDDFYSVNSKDAKFPMNLLADQEYGNRLLLGTNWEGYIDFDNITQRKAFEKYLFR